MSWIFKPLSWFWGTSVTDDAQTYAGARASSSPNNIPFNSSSLSLNTGSDSSQSSHQSRILFRDINVGYDHSIPLLSQNDRELIYVNGNLYNIFKAKTNYRYTCNSCHQHVIFKKIDIDTVRAT
jgi:hypothetical protein